MLNQNQTKLLKFSFIFSLLGAGLFLFDILYDVSNLFPIYHFGSGIFSSYFRVLITLALIVIAICFSIFHYGSIFKAKGISPDIFTKIVIAATKIISIIAIAFLTWLIIHEGLVPVSSFYLNLFYTYPYIGELLEFLGISMYLVMLPLVLIFGTLVLVRGYFLSKIYNLSALLPQQNIGLIISLAVLILFYLSFNFR